MKLLAGELVRMKIMSLSKWKFRPMYLCQRRYLCVRTSLVGRDFISPEDFTSRELKSFMWSASCFKHSKGQRNAKILQNIYNCNATIIMTKPHINSQVLISSAMNLLGCTANIVIDECWEETPYSIIDIGRSLSKLTNIIIAVSCHHDSVNALRDGASVPVVNFSSSSFQLIECLANLLTVQEHYGFLQGLKIGWIGPPHAALNTYISLSSKLEMNVQFTAACREDKMESQEILNTAMKNAVKSGAQISQCLEAKDAIYRAHIVVTTMHPFPELQVTRELVSEAAVNWILLHHLPRSSTEVSAEVFNSKNSLVLEAYENQMWILMAVATHLLKEYQPTCEIPDFEGIRVPPQQFYQP